ncbi:Methyltransferase-like protein 4 [Madurella mycetomatis]|uniref:Methyltransferase-like protein 4 n=1 Tax=Madurella mycetomatis TaxID=100816 RepID=A0A175VTT5_9PEZI|nr:Methyltransferase-like protein 4 [Madurella mycetomatis]
MLTRVVECARTKCSKYRKRNIETSFLADSEGRKRSFWHGPAIPAKPRIADTPAYFRWTLNGAWLSGPTSTHATPQNPFRPKTESWAARESTGRAMSPSSILWQNDHRTVVLLDLPRSIEEAQVPSSQLTAAHGGTARKLRRLISAPPPGSPFPTPEPKDGGSGRPALSPSAQVTELMTAAAVESALAEIKESYSGPWCLPRLCSQPKLKPPSSPPAAAASAGAATGPSLDPHPATEPPDSHHLPASSHPLTGTIQSHRATFLSTAPKFNLILLDPAWPNRSAKRKRTGPGSYHPAADLASIRAILSQVPVASHLAEEGGLVAVWVTNAARFADLLLTSVFAEWGVELVGEWTWLKVTAAGEPVVSVESAWRKPWERLLIARRTGGEKKGAVRGKVIVSVPDVHSRKPNLRGLFEGEGLVPEKYEALEVFARNLTAGWWAWGDEALLFQRKECWVDEEEEQWNMT